MFNKNYLLTTREKRLPVLTKEQKKNVLLMK